MAHLATTGIAGSLAAGSVGLFAAARRGWADLRLLWQHNWLSALALGVMAGVPVAAFVTIFVAAWTDGLSVGAAFFAVAFVHGLDLVPRAGKWSTLRIGRPRRSARH